jgi:hypothetical protein
MHPKRVDITRVVVVVAVIGISAVVRTFESLLNRRCCCPLSAAAHELRLWSSE